MAPDPVSSPRQSMLPLTGGRLGRMVALWALSESVGRTAKGWVDKARNERAYTVSVEGDDDIYGDLHDWLLAAMPSDRQRSILASTRHGRDGDMSVPVAIGDDTSRPAPKVQLFYDGAREQTVTLAGVQVKVRVDRQDQPANDNRRYAQPEKMIFTCTSEAGRRKVLDFIEQVAAAKVQARTAAVYIADRWGDWNRRNDLPARPVDSVVLRDGQIDGLVDDLARFIAAEQTYADLGVPWHRGYLFHGPAGTGKTSLARTLATRFGFDLYYLPLTDVDRDTNLLNVVSRVRPRAVLLLEDIDVLYGATHRDEGPKGVTLSGLLNALDGVSTPHGLITIMTTNNLTVLDDALIRPGRVDRLEEVSFCDQAQFDGLVERFAPGQQFFTLKSDAVSPALVVEAVKRHLGDVDGLDDALAHIAAHGRLPSLTDEVV